MKIITTLRTIFLNKEDQEIINLINSTDDMVLSVEEKKQWIKLLPQMTKEQKNKFKNILLDNKEWMKEVGRQIEEMKRFYKEDLEKIYEFNIILENLLKIFEDNLSVLVKIFQKNPIKNKINNILNLNNLNNNYYKFYKNYWWKKEIKNKIKISKKYWFLFKIVHQSILQAREYLLFNTYLSKQEVEEIKNKLEKAKNIKDDKNNELLFEYLYQIQQGRDIKDIEIEIRKKENDIINRNISIIWDFWNFLKTYSFIKENQLIEKEILNKYNKNLAKIYAYLYFC